MHLLFFALAFAAPDWRVVPRGDVELLLAQSPGEAAEVRAEFGKGAITKAELYSSDPGTLARLQAERLNEWAAKEAPGVEAFAEGDTLSFSAPETLWQKTLDARDRIRTELLSERMLRVAGNGRLVIDVARIAAAEAPALASLAKALAAETPRAAALRSLQFVQSIPYKAGTPGTFRSPLRVLGDHKGDCDEKSALFLGLMRANHPTLGLAYFRTAGHAWVGLEIPPEAGERTAEGNGARWVLAEPSGPRLAPLGTTNPISDAAFKAGTVEMTRVP